MRLQITFKLFLFGIVVGYGQNKNNLKFSTFFESEQSVSFKHGWHGPER